MAWSSEKLEIYRHAMVGFTVAFVLVVFEQLLHFLDSLKEYASGHPVLSSYFEWPLLARVIIIVLLGLTAGWIAFGLIVALEKRARRKVPIVIPKLGRDVDGIWVNAVVQGDEIIGYSWFTIESSSATDRFTIKGKTYRREDVQGGGFDVNNEGTLDGVFSSKEGSLFGSDGISYPFYGKRYVRNLDGKRSEQDRLGVVYYQFEEVGEETFLTGAFLSVEEEVRCRVTGKLIGKPGEYGVDKPSNVRDHIQGWMRSDKVADFRRGCDEHFQHAITKFVAEIAPLREQGPPPQETQ